MKVRQRVCVTVLQGGVRQQIEANLGYTDRYQWRRAASRNWCTFTLRLMVEKEKRLSFSKARPVTRVRNELLIFLGSGSAVAVVRGGRVSGVLETMT